MEKTKVTYMDVDSLIPYANNPRLNDNAVDAVAASIKEFGFKVPIVVDGENVIINGHTRLKAAHKLGLKQVPVILDAQRPEGKAIYGCGFLLSESAAREAEAAAREAEAANAECVWELSERERGIVAGLGKNDDDREESESIPEDSKR